MKQKIIGTYYIGHEQAQLVLREGTGGEFYCCPEKGSVPRIKVGADHRRWDEVVAVLLHEAFEFCMTRSRCRYEPSMDLSNDHSSYLFVMTHPEFSDCCARAAEYMAAALPDLSRAWKSWTKKRR